MATGPLLLGSGPFRGVGAALGAGLNELALPFLAFPM